MNLKDVLNVEDMRQAARRRLPNGLFEFIDRATEDDVALRRNREALSALQLLPRAMVDVSQRDTSTSLLGSHLRIPLAIAPAGPAGLFWYQGETELARAASSAGVPFTLSSYTTTPIEEIAATGVNLWCQLYLWQDRDLSDAVLIKAKNVGVQTLMVTVDTPLVGQREYLARNGFGTPFRPSVRSIVDILRHPRWATAVPWRYWVRRQWPQVINLARPKQEPTDGWATRTALGQNLTWSDISRLRDIWQGNLLLKGILRPDDAEKAIQVGCEGVVVSNHGGRNLDSAVSPIDVLPHIASAIGSRGTIIMDGGIRRGSDILKAIALGAHAVLSGRPLLYGIGAYGRVGAEHVLSLLHDEFDRTMALVGVRSIAELTSDLIFQAGTHPSKRLTHQ
jgi:(S)-mandelate dehydrogenase